MHGYSSSFVLAPGVGLNGVMLIKPNDMAETSRSLFPSFLFGITKLLGSMFTRKLVKTAINGEMIAAIGYFIGNSHNRCSTDNCERRLYFTHHWNLLIMGTISAIR